MSFLRRISPSDLPDLRRDPCDVQTLREAEAIVDSVREGGAAALRDWAIRLGDLSDPDAPLILGPATEAWQTST